MRTTLKYFLLVISFLILIIPSKVFAESDSYIEYIIGSYDIDMIVNEDNTFDITEKITATFELPKHGIYRKIPLKNDIVRNDGTQSSNRAIISDISVNEKYDVYKEGDYKIIRVGRSDQTIIGTREYEIKYRYDIGNDPLINEDEFYYNLIGDKWDTSISNLSFKITMPKAFDATLLGFSSGEKGSMDSSDVIYNVDGNVISGILQKTLNAGEAFTVRLSLPEGYFVREDSKIDSYAIDIIAICISFVLVSGMLWKKYGKDDEITDTLEYCYPPKDLNSAEVAFIYEGKVDRKAIISLLIYLADKGYLKIEETEDVRLFKKKKGFKITKIKEYDGDNEYEKMFFEGLFNSSKSKYVLNIEKAKEIMNEAKANGAKISFKEAMDMATMSSDNKTKNTVTSADLFGNFYITFSKILSKINSKDNKNKIFEPLPIIVIIILVLMVIAIFALITVKPLLKYGDEDLLMMAMIFPGAGFVLMLGALVGLFKNYRLFSFFWGALYGGISWSIWVLPLLLENPIDIAVYVVGLICVAFILYFIKIMPKRTTYGNEIYEKIKGFKKFLESSEKSELEKLVLQNPEYFYNILPYTYALGVSDVWVKQFDTIGLKKPEWYDSSEDFDLNSFGSFMNTAMSSISNAASSSSSGDGDGSGGGSSGGGSGGGGGGSW